MVAPRGGSGGGSCDVSLGMGKLTLTSREGWAFETRTVESCELVVRPSSYVPSSRICEENSIVRGTGSSVASVSGSSSLITPFNASRRPVIRGDRLGDIGGSEPGARSMDLDGVPSPFSV